MKSIDFPKANVAIAKDQPQYQTIYGHVDKTGNDPTYAVTLCFELDPEEIEQIAKTGKLYYTQLTFGQPFSPIRMSTVTPFLPEESECSVPPMDENRTPADVWDKTHYKGTEGTIYPGQGYVIHGPCSNCGAEEYEHYWSTRQCKIS